LLAEIREDGETKTDCGGLRRKEKKNNGGGLSIVNPSWNAEGERLRLPAKQKCKSHLEYSRGGKNPAGGKAVTIPRSKLKEKSRGQGNQKGG